ELCEVPGQQVVERRDIGAALDAGVTAQREDAAAGPADVAQQLLEDRRGANDLNADRVLRPGHCVREAGRSIPTRVAKDGFGQLQKTLLTDTADAFDHLRRVARDRKSTRLNSSHVK